MEWLAQDQNTLCRLSHGLSRSQIITQTPHMEPQNRRQLSRANVVCFTPAGRVEIIH